MDGDSSSGHHPRPRIRGKQPDARVSLRDRRWRAAIADVREQVKAAARLALHDELTRQGRPPAGFAAEITLAADADLQALNRDWRQQDKPTNVLAFPGYDRDDLPAAGPAELGDVILAFETCAAEAAAADRPLAAHMTHLVVHGVLHLLGHDHLVEDEAERMEGREVELLAALGIADPYQVERASGAEA